MAEFVRVGPESEIPMGQIRAYEINHTRFVVAHTESGFFAIANECTHDAAPIADGELKGNEIMCRRHGARFDVTTGAVTAPPAIVPLDRYEVKTDSGDIFVQLD